MPSEQQLMLACHHRLLQAQVLGIAVLGIAEQALAPGPAVCPA